MMTTTQTRTRELARAFLAAPPTDENFAALVNHLSATKANPRRAAITAINTEITRGATVHPAHGTRIE